MVDVRDTHTITKLGPTKYRLQDVNGFIYRPGNSDFIYHSEKLCYWRCDLSRKPNIKCRATVTTQAGLIVRKRVDHNHKP